MEFLLKPSEKEDFTGRDPCAEALAIVKRAVREAISEGDLSAHQREDGIVVVEFEPYTQNPYDACNIGHKLRILLEK